MQSLSQQQITNVLICHSMTQPCDYWSNKNVVLPIRVPLDESKEVISYQRVTAIIWNGHPFKIDNHGLGYELPTISEIAIELSSSDERNEKASSWCQGCGRTLWDIFLSL